MRVLFLLLLCAPPLTQSYSSADGHVRLFRHYQSPRDVSLASSFHGISETLPTTTSEQDSGLVVEWQQGRGQALMGGNVKYIRVWDATRETMLQVSSVSPFSSSFQADVVLSHSTGSSHSRQLVPYDPHLRSSRWQHSRRWIRRWWSASVRSSFARS